VKVALALGVSAYYEVPVGSKLYIEVFVIPEIEQLKRS
jgi:hypothetical protein